MERRVIRGPYRTPGDAHDAEAVARLERRSAAIARRFATRRRRAARWAAGMARLRVAAPALTLLVALSSVAVALAGDPPPGAAPLALALTIGSGMAAVFGLGRR